MDRRLAADLDRYLTREPYEAPEQAQPVCAQCKAFLSFKPDRVEPWEDAMDCDGRKYIVKHPAEYYPEVGEIPAYEEVYFGSCDAGRVHEPHKLVLWAGVTEHRLCKRCGYLNMESLG